MTHSLPPNLLALFEARQPIQFLPPIKALLVEREPVQYTGLAQYLSCFDKTPKSAPDLEAKVSEKVMKQKLKEEVQALKLENSIADYQKRNQEGYTKDPYKTLFVSRLSIETPESKIKREFSKWGTIENIKLVNNRDGLPRGYAFIEYSRKSEMSQAYKEADGIKIDGKRVVVDYERGRTRKDWLPKRLGGGKGKGKSSEKKADDRSSKEDSKYSSSRKDDKYSSSSRSSKYERSGGDKDRDRERDRDRSSYRDRENRDRGDRDYRDSRRDNNRNNHKAVY
uniref:U1 small nuclear ribonucleoprotein 70 kDa n=1 Tax=Rhabditophanes sp. KR3021 TaxID=114890 RepID=A0AC35U969_9BILA